MKVDRKWTRAGELDITVDDMIRASLDLLLLDMKLLGVGYVRASWLVRRSRDGSYTGRIVWRDRREGLTITGAARGLVL